MSFNKNLVLGILIVSVVFMAISGILFELGTNYSVSVDEKYRDTFNRYSEIKTIYETQQASVEGGEINPEGQDSAVFTKALVSAKSVQEGSFDLFGGMISIIPEILGIDPVYITVIMVMVGMFSLFSFVAMITKKMP